MHRIASHCFRLWRKNSRHAQSQLLTPSQQALGSAVGTKTNRHLSNLVENSRSARVDACPHGVQLLAAFFHLSFDDFKGHWVGYFIELVFVVELLFGVDLFGLLGLQPGVEGDASTKVCVRVFWGWLGGLGNLSFTLKPVLKENRKKRQV